MEEKYDQCKIRNEQQLLTIRKLELEIAKTKQLIDNKRKMNLAIKEKNARYKKSTQQQKEYCIKPKPKQQTKPVIGGKRDLSLLLAIKPEKICKRIEHLLRTQSLFQKPIDSDQLYNIKQLIDRLKDPYDPNTIDKLFSDLIDSLPDIVELSINNTIDLEKERYIMEFQSYRKHKVDDLKATKEKLELDCRQSETALLHRVQNLQDNREIQSALIKMVRIKAANQQIQSELRSMQNQTEKLASQIQFIKDQNVPDIKNTFDMVEIVARMQYQAKSLLSINSSFDTTLQDQKSKSKNPKEIELLIDRINIAVSKLKTEPNHATPSIENQTNELLDAKNFISPHSSISNIQLFKELVYLIQSINSLEEHSIVDICKDIGKTLEKLVEKWTSIFNKKDIPLLNSLPENYDGIDNVIQALDTIRLHFEENRRKYLNEQEQKLTENFESIRQIKEEIDQVKEAKDERKLITTVGQTFTIEDKSFCEWLEEVELSK